jgi:hypothetical protein
MGGSHFVYSLLYPFLDSEYVSDMLHAMVVDELMIWAGGRGVEFFYCWIGIRVGTGQHLPVGGSELESKPIGVRARVANILTKPLAAPRHHELVKIMSMTLTKT